MAGFDETAVLDLGKTPIPGENPCGDDISEDPDYLLVDAEVGKVGRIESGEPDWHTVERCAADLLRSKSKDVDVVAAYGMAIFKRHGYPALAAWFGLSTELVRNFWEHLYPARERRRKARLEVLPDQFGEGSWFSDNQPKSEADFDALDVCQTRLGELEAALTERMPDDPPEFGKFKRKLKEKLDGRPKKAEPQQAPVAAGAEAAGQAAAGSGAPAAAAGGGAGAFAAPAVEDRGGAVNAAMAAASFLRKADAKDAVAYAIIRAVKWAEIRLPTSDPGRFQIEPPEAALLDKLQHQYGSQLWEHLLNSAEGAFRTSDPLWLDLQFYACTAMRNLGAPFDAAYQTVLSATGALVKRLGEGIYGLTFKSGQPLCSGETRLWLESEIGGDEPSKGGASENGHLAEAWQNARKLAGSGQLKDGLSELQAGYLAATHQRERFQWRLRMAQLFAEAQRPQLAAPLLEECQRDVERFGVNEWEPLLAVDVAQTLYKCRKALAASEKTPDEATLSRVRESFAWLCQLDPAAALSAEPSGK